MNAACPSGLAAIRRRPDDSDLFAAAARRGFPAFLTPVELSTPANATPYVIGRASFASAARSWPGRTKLVEVLERALAETGECGVEPVALLIGGSFTDLGNPAPKDIDAVAFYRRAGADAPVDAGALADLQKRAGREGADLRFIPVDGNPIVLIRSVSYFTRLYSESRPGSAHDGRRARGLVLVDCAEPTDQPFTLLAGEPGLAPSGSGS